MTTISDSMFKILVVRQDSLSVLRIREGRV